jgi:hypothetical protein
MEVGVPKGPIAKRVQKLLEPLIAWGGRGEDGRDALKPIAYDAEGRPLYAPPGITYTVDWPPRQ